LGGGYVSPAAGTGASYTGSALGATAGTTALSYVYDGLQADGLGNLYIADYNRQQILKVAPVSGNVYYGPVSVFAGNGTTAFAGNNVPATSAQLNRPYGMATDGNGNFYFADKDNGVVRKLDSSNQITTVAGIPGTCGSSGNCANPMLLPLRVPATFISRTPRRYAWSIPAATSALMRHHCSARTESRLIPARLCTYRRDADT
jgi:hypothetical protein